MKENILKSKGLIGVRDPNVYSYMLFSAIAHFEY